MAVRQGRGRRALPAPRFVPLSPPAGRLGEGALLAALIAVPFLFDVRTAQVFEPEKATLVRVAGLLVLAGALAGGLRASAPRPEARPVAWATGLFVFALAASTALAVDVPSALLGSEHRQHGLLTLLALVALGVAASLASRGGVERGLCVIAVASLPVAGYAIAQHRGIDPLPWAQDTALRVTGPLGHPAFLAAYLMMAIPIALGRLFAALQDLGRDRAGLPAALARAITYASIVVADAAAFVWAGSRGPWRGLGAALVLFFVVLGLVEGRRWLALGAAGTAVAGALALVLLNQAGGPLERLREGEGVGRLAHLLDADSGTVRVRVLIWGATMERLASTQPLAFADGRRDRLARLRPWIGFGPESFTAALLPFYPPELAHIEKEHPIPDRAHNDLLDAAVAGGLLGLLAQVGMVTAALVLGGVRLGLGSAPRLAAAIGAGGLGGLALAWLLWGRALAAVGLGLGLVVGFGVMLVAAAWRRRRDAPDTRPGEGPVLAGVLAALVGHVVETQFGLATVSTRLVAAALVGWLVAWGATRSAPPEGPSFRAVPAALGLGGLLGLTVAYGFLRIPFGLEFPGTVLLLSAGVAAGLLVLESEPRARLLAVAGSVVGALAIALVLAAGMAWINASAGGLDDTRAAQRLAWLPAILLLAFAAAALIAGLAVVIEGAGPGRVRLALASLVAVAGMAGAMRFWEADVLLAAARRLGDVGEPRASGELFQAAWRLAPFRDAIPAGAARVLIETARITVGEADRDTLLDRADGYLARAIARAPLAWAHAADRARLQLLWAGMTVEPPLRQRRLHEADRHYRATLRLHPRSPAVWNEWALLALASGARDEARLRLGRSLELDPRLDQTHRLLRAAEAPED